MGLWSKMTDWMRFSVAKRDELTTQHTANYRPSYGVPLWAMNSYQWGSFSLSYVDEMRQDAQVQLCMAYKQVPLYSAQFDVQTNDPRVQEFVTETLDRFWRKSLHYALQSYAYGYMPGEYLYYEDNGFIKFDTVRPIHPRDAKPWTVNGRLAFVRVTHIQNESHVDLPVASLDVPSKAFWLTHNPSFNPYYGRSILSPAWWPWRLKTMPDGAMESLFKWAYKHSISCMVVRHPDTNYDTEDGRLVSAQDIARQMGEQVKAGGVIAMSSVTGADGKYLWDVQQWAKPEGDYNGMTEYIKLLNQEIQRGLLVPDDVVTTQGAGSMARSQVTTGTFYNAAEQSLNHILEVVDSQMLRPLVRTNFGHGAHYVLKPKPLLPPDMQQQPGASGVPGVIPGAPGQPGVPGQAGPPPDQAASPEGLEAMQQGPEGNLDDQEMEDSTISEEDLAKLKQLSLTEPVQLAKYINRNTGTTAYYKVPPQSGNWILAPTGPKGSPQSGQAAAAQATAPQPATTTPASGAVKPPATPKAPKEPGGLGAEPPAAPPKEKSPAQAKPDAAGGSDKPESGDKPAAEPKTVGELKKALPAKKLKELGDLLKHYENHPEVENPRIVKNKSLGVSILEVTNKNTGEVDLERSRVLMHPIFPDVSLTGSKDFPESNYDIDLPKTTTIDPKAPPTPPASPPAKQPGKQGVPSPGAPGQKPPEAAASKEPPKISDFFKDSGGKFHMDKSIVQPTAHLTDQEKSQRGKWNSGSLLTFNKDADIDKVKALRDHAAHQMNNHPDAKEQLRWQQVHDDANQFVQGHARQQQRDDAAQPTPAGVATSQPTATPQAKPKQPVTDHSKVKTTKDEFGGHDVSEGTHASGAKWKHEDNTIRIDTKDGPLTAEAPRGMTPDQARDRAHRALDKMYPEHAGKSGPLPEQQTEQPGNEPAGQQRDDARDTTSDRPNLPKTSDQHLERLKQEAKRAAGGGPENTTEGYLERAKKAAAERGDLGAEPTEDLFDQPASSDKKLDRNFARNTSNIKDRLPRTSDEHLARLKDEAARAAGGGKASTTEGYLERAKKEAMKRGPLGPEPDTELREQPALGYRDKYRPKDDEVDYSGKPAATPAAEDPNEIFPEDKHDVPTDKQKQVEDMLYGPGSENIGKEEKPPVDHDADIAHAMEQYNATNDPQWLKKAHDSHVAKAEYAKKVAADHAPVARAQNKINRAMANYRETGDHKWLKEAQDGHAELENVKKAVPTAYPATDLPQATPANNNRKQGAVKETRPDLDFDQMDDTEEGLSAELERRMDKMREAGKVSPIHAKKQIKEVLDRWEALKDKQGGKGKKDTKGNAAQPDLPFGKDESQPQSDKPVIGGGHNLQDEGPLPQAGQLPQAKRVDDQQPAAPKAKRAAKQITPIWQMPVEKAIDALKPSPDGGVQLKHSKGTMKFKSQAEGEKFLRNYHKKAQAHAKKQGLDVKPQKFIKGLPTDQQTNDWMKKQLKKLGDASFYHRMLGAVGLSENYTLSLAMPEVWQPYRGPHGKMGWRNIITKDIIYQKKCPSGKVDWSK